MPHLSGSSCTCPFGLSRDQESVRATPAQSKQACSTRHRRCYCSTMTVATATQDNIFQSSRREARGSTTRPHSVQISGAPRSGCEDRSGRQPHSLLQEPRHCREGVPTHFQQLPSHFRHKLPFSLIDSNAGFCLTFEATN